MSRVLRWAGLLLYSVWVMRRVAHAQRVRSSSGARAVRILSATELDADATRYAAAGDSWTAADERQLIQLLTDSAP